MVTNTVLDLALKINGKLLLQLIFCTVETEQFIHKKEEKSSYLMAIRHFR